MLRTPAPAAPPAKPVGDRGPDRLLDELIGGSLDAVVLALPTETELVAEVPLYWEPLSCFSSRPNIPWRAEPGLTRAPCGTSARCC